MSRSDVFCIVLVVVILTPLVIVQAGPGFAPAWFDRDLAGVPVTVCATALWFVAMMLLAWRFAAAKTRAAKADSDKGEA